MEAARKRNIKSGEQYDKLFPRASGNDNTIMSNAVVSDTVAFIPRVVNSTLQQTLGIARELKTLSDYESCRNIWNFVYGHIAYRKDAPGYEQIRSPARTWRDRRKGVDCDCYTTFISSILTNLGIHHKLRITKYSRDQFQHIYPIAIIKGREVVLDCVTDKFDYEVPFSEKKDFPMDLQYLDGFESRDSEPTFGTGGIGELGRLFKKKKKASSGGDSPATDDGNSAPPSGAKKKKGFKKILNAFNKVNPATLALRNGVLAAMKLNLFNVAKRLRWSYIPMNQAKTKGINIDRWKKLVGVRQKLENIFYGAGGNPDNLKKAMLNGKGNKDKAVHGLDGLGSVYDHQMDTMSVQSRLPQLLGSELYYSENPMSALGELGEPVTAATVVAASGVIATIAATIKKIGDIFGGKGEGSKDFDENANADDQGSGTSTSSSGKASAKTSSNSGDDGNNQDSDGGGGGNNGSRGYAPFPAAKSTANAFRPVSASNAASSGSSESSATNAEGGSQESGNGVSSTNVPATQDNSGAKSPATNDGGGTNESGDPGVWEKNKKWIIPTAMGLGIVTALVIGYKMINAKSPGSGPSKPVNGIPRKKNHHRKAGKPSKGGKKAAVILL